jgi:poly(3-hydroxybutyrate) depolymerase
MAVAPPVQAELTQVKRADGSNFSVYIPSSYDGTKAFPLLTIFHWSTGRYKSVFKMWEATAEQLGIILAMPNSRARMGWKRRDIKPTEAMIKSVRAQFNIDSQRIYAAGYSSGANFAYLMMVENPGLYRAIAPFAGRLLYSDKRLTNAHASNTRVCLYHGRRDSIIRFRNGRRAAQRLRRTGYEVRARWLNQGHYFPKRFAPDIWRCLSGAQSDRDS